MNFVLPSAVSVYQSQANILILFIFLNFIWLHILIYHSNYSISITLITFNCFKYKRFLDILKIQYWKFICRTTKLHSPIRDTCVPHHKDPSFLRHSNRSLDQETIASAAWRVYNKSSPIRYLDSASRKQSQNRNWCERIHRSDECRETRLAWHFQFETLPDLSR